MLVTLSCPTLQISPKKGVKMVRAPQRGLEAGIESRTGMRRKSWKMSERKPRPEPCLLGPAAQFDLGALEGPCPSVKISSCLPRPSGQAQHQGFVTYVVCWKGSEPGFNTLWLTALKFLILLNKVLVSQSCPAFCDLMECSPPGSPVHGISQARILE